MMLTTVLQVYYLVKARLHNNVVSFIITICFGRSIECVRLSVPLRSLDCSWKLLICSRQWSLFASNILGSVARLLVCSRATERLQVGLSYVTSVFRLL